MKSRAPMLGGLAMLTIIAAGLAWRQSASTQRAVAAAREEQRRLTADLRRVEAQIETTTRKRAEIQAALEKPKAPPVPVPATAPSAAAQERMAKLVKGRLLLRYGSLYRALGFTAEETTRFEQQFIEHEARRSDIAAVANSMRGSWRPGDGPLPPQDPAIIALNEGEDKRHEAEMAALLGEANFRQFQEFERTEPRRRFVEQLVVALALTPDEISSVQAKQLRRVLDEANYGSQAILEWRNLDPILTQAQTFLTEAQFAKLEAQTGRAREKATEEIRRLVRATKK